MRPRPLSVTIFAFVVLSLTAWNAVRFFSAITSWSLLAELGAHPGPLYIALTGLAWAVSGAALFRGLWLGRRWARVAGAAYIAVYLVYFWADRLLFRPTERAQNYVFLLLLQLASIGLTALALRATPGRSYFK